MSILLISGGIDSMAAMGLLKIPGVSVELGTPARNKERKCIDWAERAFGVPIVRRELGMGGFEMDNGYLPYRNQLMVTMAAQHDPVVVMPMIAEWAPDKNLRYFKRLQRLLNQASEGDTQGFHRRVRILTPFVGLTKARLLALYQLRFGTAGVQELLSHTWSCYRDGPIHCGDCSGCRQRWVAEMKVGIPVTVWETDPSRNVQVDTENWRDAVRWIRDNHQIGPLIERGREIAWASQQYKASTAL